MRKSILTRPLVVVCRSLRKCRFHGLGRLLVTLTMFMSVASSQLRPGNVVPAGRGIASELVSIYRQGVSPQRIERTEGPFVLFIENRSLDLDDKITLHLGKTNTASLLEIVTRHDKSYDYEVIDPQPGTYHLKIAKHPGWEVEVVILAK